MTTDRSNEMSATRGHVPFETIADIVEGRLPASRRDAPLAHIAGCGSCGEAQRWLQRTLTTMRDHIGEDAPAHVVNRAIRLTRTAVLPAEAQGRLRRLVAALRFDSLATPQAMGVRSGAAATRQLIFGTEEHDLDLRVEPSGTGWRLSGQLLGEASGGTVRLVGEAAPIEAELDESLEFALEPVPAGRYAIEVRIADTVIEAEGIELGA